MQTVNGLGSEEQLGEGKLIERFDALGRPVVTDIWHDAILIQTTSAKAVTDALSAGASA